LYNPDVRVDDIRDSNDVHYRVYALRFLLNHGDMLGVKGGDGIIGAIGPIMRGEIKKSGQSAVLGLEYDINIMGHWHQELLPPRAISQASPI
jgi:predicted phosphodiesterase